MSDRLPDEMPVQEKEIDRFVKALKKELTPQLYSLSLICLHYDKDVDLKANILEIVNLIKDQTEDRFGEKATKTKRYLLQDIVEFWEHEVQSGYSGTLDQQFHRAFLQWSERMIDCLKKIRSQHQWFDPMPIAKVFLKLEV